MKRIALTAQKRTLVGRKVKQLRRQGLVPGSVYGNQVQSISVQVPADLMRKVFQEAGETGLIDLQIDQDVRPVLIKNIQTHPVSDVILHVDFYQVNLKEKVTAQVPLEQIGTAAAVVNNLGVLLTISDEVEVEALPTDLPEHIEVDISGLAEVNAVIKVKDLKIPQGVTILTDGETEVVKVGELVQAEPEPEPTPGPEVKGEAGASEGAAKEGEGEKAATAKEIQAESKEKTNTKEQSGAQKNQEQSKK